jgi:hypothetical protein
MTVLTDVGALSSENGVLCQLALIRDLLNRGTQLELFCAGEIWKPLVKVRVIIADSTSGNLTTSDKSVYQSRPDDLIRVRIPQKGR